MIRRYSVDALVVVVVFCACLLALEGYRTWQRVNSMWVWVNDQNTRMQQAQQPQLPHAPAPEAPKKQ